MDNITAYELINEYFTYDSTTGKLYWKKSPKNQALLGLEAGRRDYTGYLRITLGKLRASAHRIGWALHFKQWPNGALDHINGIRDDNRIENLREVTYRQNSQNRSEHRRGHLAGAGYHKGTKKWMARIFYKGKSIYIGLYATEQLAHEAYLAALAKLETECV